MRKKLLFSIIAFVFLFLSCQEQQLNEITTEPVAKSSGATTTIVQPAKTVALYYPSTAVNEITLEEVITKSNSGEEYASDYVIPSFCVIGDGVTKIPGEDKPWVKNIVGFDSAMNWGGLDWTSNPLAPGEYQLGYYGAGGLGTNSIIYGLMQSTKQYAVAIGGTTDSDRNDPLRAGAFDRIGGSPVDIDAFVASALDLEYIVKETRAPSIIYLNYAYPSNSSQGKGFLNIVKALHTKAAGKVKIMVGLSPRNIEHLGFLDFPELTKYVDSFEIMSFDYMSPSTSSITGHHTALYAADKSFTPPTNTTSGYSDDYNIDAQVKYLLGKGVPSIKIKIGVALYGRVWQNVTIPAIINSKNAYFATGTQLSPFPNSSSVGSAYQTDGTMKYYDILSQVTTNNGWEIHLDPTSKGAFAVNRSLKYFISYDSEESILLKAQYVKEKNLGGVVVWDATMAKGTSILSKLYSAVK